MTKRQVIQTQTVKIEKEMTPQEKWKMKRDTLNAERDFNASQLSESQRKALMDAFIAIRNADFSCHEMFRLDVEDMIAIDKAEYTLRSQFPQLTEEAIGELTCTCED
tara:strand:+ start:344 stop:664 length:321 start_codon:yes stop_codon:yes gene_type:complete